MGKHTAQIITRIVPIGPDGQVENSPVSPETNQLTLMGMNPTDAPLGPAQARLAQQASAASGKTKDKAATKTTTKTAKTTAAKRNSRTATKVIPMEAIAPESHDGYDVSRLQNLEEAIARLNSQSQHVRHTLEELQKLSEALPKPPRALEMPDFGRNRLAVWEAEPIDQALTLQEAQQRHQTEIPLAPHSNPHRSSPTLPIPPLARPSQTTPQRPTQRPTRSARRRPVKKGWNVRSIAPRLVKLWNQRLPIPQKSGAKAIDGMLWLAGAMGLRWLVGMAVGFVPVLGWVLQIMMLVPGIYAAYLAFCQPDSRTDQVYRLSLLTLGFFLGSKL
jgi:hypothetical protein